MNWLYTLMQFVPKNLISFCCGLLARLNLPEPFSILLNKLFVLAFKINMSEADKELVSYRNIEEVFTRHLKKDCRSIKAAVCSPADGYLSYSQPLHAIEEAIQAKGMSYSPKELVFAEKASSQSFTTSPAWFSTIYLAPHNYHRVHSPVSGKLLTIRYIPGELWPVNDTFVQIVPRLFCRNERLVFELEEKGGGKVYVVMIGALNVGRIASLHWPAMVTNAGARQLQQESLKEKHFAEPVPIAAGDELGVFMLGSTVVLIFEEDVAKRYELRHAVGKSPIRMGESLCQ